MKHTSLIALAVLSVVACTHEKNAEAPAEALTSNSTVDVDVTPSSTKLLKVAAYRFQVADARQSLGEIERIVGQYPAYIADSRMSVSGARIEHNLTVRIPPDYLDSFLRDIDSLSILTDFRNVTATDVTQEFVDLESRLRTKREVHERLKEILRTKTGTIEDVLAAERQLGEIQEEIEAATSRLNSLKDRIAYSRIDIEMYQILRQEATFTSGAGTRFRNAFTSGFDGSIEVLIGLTHVWPLLLLISGVGILYRRKTRM